MAALKRSEAQITFKACRFRARISAQDFIFAKICKFNATSAQVHLLLGTLTVVSRAIRRFPDILRAMPIWMKLKPFWGNFQKKRKIHAEKIKKRARPTLYPQFLSIVASAVSKWSSVISDSERMIWQYACDCENGNKASRAWFCSEIYSPNAYLRSVAVKINASAARPKHFYIPGASHLGIRY